MFMTRDFFISLIVAVAENGIIGADGDMPWQLSTDLRRFKALTLGKPVIMGRKTFDSIGKALPGRPNFVITRNKAFDAEGVQTVASLDEAIERASQWLSNNAGNSGAANEICIIGGGQIYADAMAIADRLHVTHVMAKPEGDTRFPVIDPKIWRSVGEEAVPVGEKDNYPSLYAVYERWGVTS